MNRAEKSAQYYIEQLQAEIDVALGDSHPLALRIYMNPVFRFLTRHLQNLYWTVTRFMGLGHWHDGSRPEPPMSSRPVLKAAAPLRNPRILIDATQTFSYGGTTGIQRVVREIAAAAAASGDGFPVIIKEGRFAPFYEHPNLEDEIEVGAGDFLLLLDSAWYKQEAYWPVLTAASQRGCRIILGIHDLIPLHHSWATEAIAVTAFRAWLERAIPLADAVVTISRSVALDICDYLPNVKHKPDLRVGWHHLGADFASDSSTPPSKEIVDICNRGPFFLTVGMVEPRKAHPVALSAFEKLWNAGIDARYVIVGAYGWKAHAVRKRICEHPEFGHRLFWLQAASDADLRHAYRHATSLVYPSFAEGFGLPLVEAARHGLPIIASDIPVFHEIGGDAITYFELLDADCLAARIRAALNGKSIAPSFPILTWQQATAGLLALIRNGNYQFSPGAKLAHVTRAGSAVGKI
jgi:glycosyltransferase involved in cell wall biosynthesis